MRAPLQFWLIGAALAACCAARAGADEPGVRFFEAKVRPLLVEHCFKCHSTAAEKVKGGLRLDTLDAMLRGGESGPAIVSGNPADSRLMKAVGYGDQSLQMPPKAKLPDQAVADLTRWVAMGAPWPEGAPPTVTTRSEPATRPGNASAHWAFQPVRRHALPPVSNSDWPRSDIDRFILAKLEHANLRPAPPADKRTLIRRATFDLTGLPPTPAEIAAFLADESPTALAPVVDRLLASPHYGERAARRWLDLARYADTNGADENYALPNAWRYRDYVVRAFNADLPYDRFVTEQLAGDLLPGDGIDPLSQAAHDRLIATGFLVVGPKMLAEQDKPKLVMDVVDEQVDTVGQTFLGLTLGCARCHDHKFDPIPAADYYALAGIFKSTRTMADLGFVSNWNERDLPTAESQAHAEQNRNTITAAKAELAEASKSPEGNEGKKRVTALKKKVAELERAPPVGPRAMAVAEDKPQDVPIYIRGNHLTPAAKPTPRGFVKVLDSSVPPPKIDPNRSGRLELAQWLTDPANPLTARVMVNRIWQVHFGAGLVSTPSNFGLRGSPPSHPELLDWLAGEFIQGGWSAKRMHRAIMLSSTYQMAVRHDPRAAEIDPDNRLLSRQNRRRLEAEPIRDALLAVGGNLDLTIGGALPMPAKEKYTAVKEDDAAYRSNRRAVYLPVVRSRMYDLFNVFDYVDAGVHTPQRSVTTVPQQALFMLNSPLVADQAEALAKRILAISGDDSARVRHAYELLYARLPTRPDVERAIAYLASTAAVEGTPEQRRTAAWSSLCRVLIAANEFIHVN